MNQSEQQVISKDQSDILVAIGKLETKVDVINSVVRDINTGLANRVLNLESNAVSKIEVTSQFEDIDERMLTTEKLANRTDTILRFGGAIAIIVLGLLEFALTYYK